MYHIPARRRCPLSFSRVSSNQSFHYRSIFIILAILTLEPFAETSYANHITYPIKDTIELRKVVVETIEYVENAETINYDSIEPILEQALLLKDTISFVELGLKVGRYYDYKGDYKRAITLFTSYLNRLDERWYIKVGRFYNDLGNCYNGLGYHINALEYYYKCL
ncbi:MAG: hypothetical protein AAGJ18_16310, partial [Bacteroidota bacterium]